MLTLVRCQSRMLSHAGAGLLTAGLLIAFSASSASAAPSSFSCRASAARAGALGNLSVEPVIANSADQPCVPDSRRVLTPTSIAGLVTVNALSAATATPEMGVSANASVTSPSINLPGLAISANVLSASAAYACHAGQAVPAGFSQVVGLTVNGTAISVPAGNQPVTVPLGPLGSLVLNQTVQDSSSLTQRALALTTPLATVVLAEATVDQSGSPCALGNNGGGGGGNNGGGGSGGGSGGGPVLTVSGGSPGTVPGGGSLPVTTRTHNKGHKTASRERTCVKLSTHSHLKAAPGARRTGKRVYCWPYRDLPAGGSERHRLRIRVSGVCGRYMYAILYTEARGVKRVVARLYTHVACKPKPRLDCDQDRDFNDTQALCNEYAYLKAHHRPWPYSNRV
jgi:hypothetical protein